MSYDLLPATSFEPSFEEITRFAAQLTRSRPQASRLVPRRASSVRIRWHVNDDGLLGMRLEGPASAASVLRHQTYANVEVRRVDIDGADPQGDSDATDAGTGKDNSPCTARPDPAGDQ